MKRLVRLFLALTIVLAASSAQPQLPVPPVQNTPLGRTGGDFVQEPSGVSQTVINNRQRTPAQTDAVGLPPPVRRVPADPRDRLELTPAQTDAVGLPPPVRRVPADPRDRLEFQDFIQQSTGRDLQIFGADLFRDSPSTFAPVDNVPVVQDYVIGPGDEVVIRAWGQIDVDFSAVVDRNGTISIPKVGVLNVSGIKYGDLTGFLKSSFGRTFRNFELTATLGRLRSIQIFVVGQARRPGTYTVSSMSSLVTALFSVGGPSAKGSMRGIQLKRANKVIANLDLYDLLVSGDKSKDAPLLPGDVIYIPPVGPLVAVNGSINVPAIYELARNTSLAEVMRWAGGLSTSAEGQKVAVERIVDRKARSVEEFTLDSSGLAREVRDGDLVTVRALQPRFENTVTLRGNVAQPGRFPWRSGMRVSDVIPSKDALISRDYWQRRNQIVGIDPAVARLLAQDSVVPGNPMASSNSAAAGSLDIADLLQRRGDDSLEQTIGESVRRRQVEAQAQRLSQAPVNSIDATRVVNQIRPSLKEVNWDYALVERLQERDLRTTLIPFNLGKAIIEGDQAQNLSLQPGDVITIFSKEDIPGSVERQTRFIRLDGEFRSGGIFEIKPGETLRQLVSRVGGLTASAYLFGAEFTRESTRVQQQKTLDEALARLERDTQRLAVSRTQNITSPEEASATRQQSEAQQALVSRLRSLRPSGRVVLSLGEGAVQKDLPDLPLEDGDRFFVPSLPSMVTVFGAVFNENAYIYKPERRVADYLAQAGGPTKDADRGSIYLLRADGSVISSRQSGILTMGNLDGVKVMPGDSIIVPEELDKTSFTRTLKDFAQIFYQIGLGAAAIKVLRQ